MKQYCAGFFLKVIYQLILKVFSLHHHLWPIEVCLLSYFLSILLCLRRVNLWVVVFSSPGDNDARSGLSIEQKQPVSFFS